MNVLRRLYTYVRPYRLWAIIAFGSMMVVAGTNGAMVTLVQPLFDDVLSRDSSQAAQEQKAQKAKRTRAIDFILENHKPPEQRTAFGRAVHSVLDPAQKWWEAKRDVRWKYVLVALAMVIVLRAASMFFSEYAFERVGLSTVRDLRNAVYESIIRQSNRFFSKRPTGELVSRIVSDADAVQAAVSVRMGDLFQESLNLIVLFAIVVLRNTELALVTFVIGPIIVLPVVQFGKRLRRATRVSQERMADIATILEESIKGFRIVKAFAMEKFEIRRFHEATQRHLQINLKARRIQATSSPVMELLAGFCMVLLFGYASIRIKAGVLTLGEFIAFLLTVSMMYAPIKRLNKVNLAMNTALSAAERMFNMLDVENDVKEKPQAKSLAAVGSGIEYDRVSFTYDSEPVLTNINLKIAPGEMIAIVGGSGAGKSTLVNLLPRFYDVTGGSLTIDGTDVREYTFDSLRGMIGIVTQEVILFNDSVRNNIAYGRADVPMEKIVAAARAANAADFIEALPEGYDAQIGESGVLLSGGQRQRLAIARAIMKDSPILILDEATSALDTESERLVQQALANLMEGRTTLVIAHRLSTVRRANKIVVLERGDIAEIGTHDELLALDRVYRKLYDLQFLEDDKPAGEGA
ncbi:MAG: ABC transporter transmembrane domain-containing protein [Thermoanaerobaculia bacterium]|jgi:subfamily B ATP-binding cassette protein MsbA